MASKYSAPLKEQMSHWAGVPDEFCSFTRARDAPEPIFTLMPVLASNGCANSRV